MKLSDTIKLGTSIPQAFTEGPVDMDVVRKIVTRSEDLGFESLWTSSSVLGGSPSLEPTGLLHYVAGFTHKVRLGVSVLVFPLHSPVAIAKSFASLDQVSCGRAIVGLGLGSADDSYGAFGLTSARRVKRFEEGIRVMKSLWTQSNTNHANEFLRLENAMMEPKPLQKPHMPLWIGGGHHNVLRRSVRLADGWMGAGASSNSDFKERVGVIKDMMDESDRDPDSFTISKRIYIAVDSKESRAIERLGRWTGTVYGNADMASDIAVWGSPEKCSEILNDVASVGVDHLLIHPVFDFEEQLEAIAEICGLR